LHVQKFELLRRNSGAIFVDVKGERLRTRFLETVESTAGRVSERELWSNIRKFRASDYVGVL